MTRAEVVSLRDNSVAIPAAIESEDGSLHTISTRDWEEDDMGKIKITDASGVHYEIKPDPSCSTQIKHGRRLVDSNSGDSLSLTSTTTETCEVEVVLTSSPVIQSLQAEIDSLKLVNRLFYGNFFATELRVSLTN